MKVVAGPEAVVLLPAGDVVPDCDVVTGPDEPVLGGAVVAGSDDATVVPLPLLRRRWSEPKP